MSLQQSHALLEISFQVDSIDPIPDPNGGSAPWFRYVISQGANRDNAITGTRSGSLNEVKSELHDMVARLNERCGKLANKKQYGR
jgi:hypothetical protein